MVDDEVQLRQDALELFKLGINSVRGEKVIEQSLSLQEDILFIEDINSNKYEYDLKKYRRIYIAGAGKVACQMASGIEKLFSEKEIHGIIATKYGFGLQLGKIKVLEAGHPVPDKNSLKAGKLISELVKSATKNDLIIFLVSGGASSLIEWPKPGITLNQVQSVTEKLIKSGASIEKLNYIRKVFSNIKGGGLSRLAHPAEIITLIISDVVGDDIGIIGSGPTFPFHPDVKLVKEILKNYKIDYRAEKPFFDVLERQNVNQRYAKSSNLILANNSTALNAVAKYSGLKGYKPVIIQEKIVGNVNEAAELYAEKVKRIISNHQKDEKLCIISGGETTVNVKGSGRGGRNLEFAMRSVNFLSGMPGCVLLSAGTDGDDGNSGVAGGLVFFCTGNKMHDNEINYIKLLLNNDSLTFFELLGDTVNIGNTSTNVMDLQIFLRI